MPIYEFLCRDCENRFDDLVSMSDQTPQACPDCRSGDVVKLYSPFSVGASTRSGDPVMAGGGACLPGPAGRGGGGGGCCGGGCGGCG